jgi:peroxiredoxin
VRQIFLRLAAGGLVVAAVVAGVWLFRDLSRPLLPPDPELPASAAGKLYATKLPDTDGHERSLSRWRGKVLVVNYWATWCKPCREEMPMFSMLHKRYALRGVQFVGIAADDPDKVREFARQSPVSYPLLVGGERAIESTRDFGNTPLAVPFTVVLDPDGNVRAAVLGRVAEDALDHLLDRLAQSQ